MKRIYLLVFLFAAFAMQASAQTNLKLIHANFKAGDTVKWAADGSWGRIIQWRFKNLGPNALVASKDTLLLKRPYGSIRLYLPAAGLAVGDSVSYTDTVNFTSQPSSNPYNWCDTLVLRSNGSVMVDPDPSDNSKCFSVIFKKMPGVSVDDIEVVEKGLTIYPNPASSSMTVKSSFLLKAEGAIVVKDITGKTIYTSNFDKSFSNKNEVTVDVSSFAAGMYIVELSSENNRAVSKFNIVR